LKVRLDTLDGAELAKNLAILLSYQKLFATKFLLNPIRKKQTDEKCGAFFDSNFFKSFSIDTGCRLKRLFIRVVQLFCERNEQLIQKINIFLAKYY